MFTAVLQNLVGSGNGILESGKLQWDTEPTGTDIVTAKDLPVLPCYAYFRYTDYYGQPKTETMRVTAEIGEKTYSVDRDIYGDHSTLPWWAASTPFIASDDDIIIPISNLTPLGSGTFSTTVDSSDTQIDFGSAMDVGSTVYVLGYDGDGVYRSEYMRIGRLVSGTTYVVTRDLSDENTPDPEWPSGTDYSLYPETTIMSSTYLIDVIDVTDKVSFGTQLHGGFSTCSFSTRMSADKAYSKENQWLGCELIIYDDYGRVCWEGIVDKSALSNTYDELQVEASGYYSKASHKFFDMVYLSPEATTNLVQNPSFENNVTDGGWTLQTGSGGGAYRDIADSFYGSCSAVFYQPDVNPDLSFYTVINVTAGQKYILSFYSRAEELSVTPYIQIMSGSTELLRTQLSGVDTEWRRYQYQAVTAPSTTLTIVFNLPNRGSTPQGYWWIDAVQFEQKEYVTDYCDGTVSGCSWSGTAHNSTSSRAAISTYAYQIIEDAVGMIPEWSGVSGTLRVADYDVGPQDFTGKKIKDGIEWAMSTGKNWGGYPVATYFAIYDHRTPYVLFEKPIGYNAYPDWFLIVDSINNKVGVSFDLSGVYNKIYSVYEDVTNGPSVTDPSGDLLSQIRYGVREGLIQNSDVPYTLTKSLFIQEAALDRYKFPRQVYSLEISGFVRSSSGFYDFPYRIRAGDTVVITDLGRMFDGGDSYFNGMAFYGVSGFVLNTEYGAEDGVVRLDIGSSDLSFEILMSRLGISGGLQ